jgi:flagellar protein FlgJ
MDVIGAAGMGTEVLSQLLHLYGPPSAAAPLTQARLSPAVLAGAAEGAAQQRAKMVDKAAAGFEEVFWSLVLKEMRQTLGPEGFFGSDTGDVLGGMFDQFMSQHLSQAQVLGIAALVRQQLETTPRVEDRPAGATPHERSDLRANPVSHLSPSS